MRRDTVVCILLAGTVFLLAASPVGAHYPLFRFDEQRTGNASGDGPQTHQILWSTDIGGLVDSSPVVAHGKVFVSTWWIGWAFNGGLYCLNESTGEIVWKNSIGGGGGASTAAVEGERVFVGSLTGDLYCINASTGETIWSKQLEHDPGWWGVASSPLVHEGLIFVTTFSNHASNNGTLHAFDFDGNEVWNISAGDTFSYTSPAVADGKLYFAGNLTNPSLFCVDLATREMLWRFNTSTQIKSTPAISDNTVFFASAERLYALNATDGSELWNHSLNCAMSSPAVSHGKVYIGSSDSGLYCYDAQSGTELWRFSANGPIYSSPVVANNTVYFGTNTANGTIYAVDAADGTLIWSYSLNPPSGSYYNIMSSPAVSDGILFIGADDGRVYAFGPKFAALTIKVRIEGKNETIWNGDVTLSNSTIIDTNGTSHYIPYPSALGALDEAARKGNFSYEVVYYPTYDALYVKSIANESDWWHYWVNYTAPSVGADSYGLNEGDSVLWGYSESWTPSPLLIALEKKGVKVNERFNVTVLNISAHTTTPLKNATVYAGSLDYTTDENGNATISVAGAGLYVVYAEKDGYLRSEKEKIQVLPNSATVKVRIEGRNATIWSGKVTFSNSTIVDTDNVSHDLVEPTALGAVDAASKLGNFTYEVENQTWGLFLKSISGEAYDPRTWYGWMYRVDYYSPMLGAAEFILNQTAPPNPPHSEVLWYYGSWTDAPLRIMLDKTSVKVNEQFSAMVQSYNDTSGVWDLVDSAAVHVDGTQYTTDINGSTVISISNVGSYIVYAEKEGYIRSEQKSVTVSPDGGGGSNGITYWWSGSVTLPSGTFTKTAFNTQKPYTITWWTALGALQKAAEVGGFSYEIEETTWGPFVYSVGNKKKYDEGATSGWMYLVNGEVPMVGAHEYPVRAGDELIWYFSKSMETTPSTSSRVLRIMISGSSSTPSPGGTSDSTPTRTTPPEQTEEARTIEFLEAGGNASLTFNKTEITRLVITANQTIHAAKVAVEPLERPLNITNVSGIPYRYFNITATNMSPMDIRLATIEFRVNRTWIADNNIDEATITLYRYTAHNWSALPTTKVNEDNASSYFASETPAFSLFAIAGEQKQRYQASAEQETEPRTEAEPEPEIEEPLPGSTAVPSPAPAQGTIPPLVSVPEIPLFLIMLVIAGIAIAGMIIVALRRR